MILTALADFGVKAANYDGGAWSPYLIGAVIGILSWFTFYSRLMVGSNLYAELSGWLKQSVEKMGRTRKLMIPNLLRVPRLPFAVATAVLLNAGLFFLQRAFPR